MPRGGLGTCYVCRNRLPGSLLHEHHKDPRAAGGSDKKSNLTVLCALCHNACHQATRFYSKGQTSQTRDVISLLVKEDPDAAARMMELVQQEARAWKAGHKADLQQVTFDLERGIYESLKGIGQTTLNVKGRPMGVGRLLRTIILKWLEAYQRQQQNRAKSMATETKKEAHAPQGTRPEVTPRRPAPRGSGRRSTGHELRPRTARKGRRGRDGTHE